MKEVARRGPLMMRSQSYDHEVATLLQDVVCRYHFAAWKTEATHGSMKKGMSLYTHPFELPVLSSSSVLLALDEVLQETSS